MLRIAIQKSGRLNEDSVLLLKECGLKFAGADRKLIAKVENFDLEILYLRDDDIPRYVYEGVADIGIVGENVLVEANLSTQTEKKLGFGKCRLSLAIPKEADYSDFKWFSEKRIATSYRNVLDKWLVEKGIKARIEDISGSVEIAPGIGLADGICDLVSSGSTLISNGLKEVEVIMQSEAVLISTTKLSVEKRQILESLVFRINAVQKAQKNKYILLNAPLDAKDEIIKLLPGIKSPTVLPLAESGWCSIHTVIEEDKFWEIIEKLKNAGAQGILVVPIEKMIV
ncbi:MAG: ATP phosphoribosyltransferase [Cytophagales bacterium]